MTPYNLRRKNLYRSIMLHATTNNTIKTCELKGLCEDAGYSSCQSFQDTIDVLKLYGGIHRIKRGVYGINLARMRELFIEERDSKWEHDSSPETVITNMREFVGRKFVSKKALRLFFFSELSVGHSLHYQRYVVEPYIKSGYISMNDKGVYEITKLCLAYDVKKELPSTSPVVRKTIKEKIKSAFDNHKMPKWVVAVRVWKEGFITTMQNIYRTINQILRSPVPS